MKFEGGLHGVVIVISAFMIQVFTAGVAGTIGVYNIEFLEHFQVSASEVSLVSALNAGAFLGSGPIVSFLMTKFSYRKIVLGGSTLVVLGLLAVPLFPNLYVMYLTLGILVGFGCCCTYIPSHTLCGLYYDKHRSLATGIAASGYGFGYAVLPVVTGLFIQTYAWKGSFIIVAGLCLHLYICGALLRNPPIISKVTRGEDGNVLFDKGNESIIKDCVERNGETFQKFTEECDEHIMSNGNASESNDCVLRDCEMICHTSREEHDRCIYSDELDSIEIPKGIKKDDILEDVPYHTRIQKDQSAKRDVERIPNTARHIYIFKNFNFVIYFTNNYLWNASCYMKGAFVPEYFRTRGNSILDVSWLVACYGMGIFFGGIFGSVLGNIKGVNRIFLYIIACLSLGLFTILIPLGQNFAFFAAMMVLTGMSLGILLGLLMVLLADLVGIESLGNGMGYLLFSSGMGTFTGPVIAGALIDSTKSYELNLYASGIVALMSVAVMCLIPGRQYFKSFARTPDVSMKTDGDGVL